MKQAQFLVIPLILGSLVSLCAARTNSGERVVDFKAANGTILKGTYFDAAKPGPGVLLFHQSNRTRKSWEDVAKQLADAGISVLTVDSRGHGESGGTSKEARKTWWPADLDAAIEYLASQPGVQRDLIGVG